MSQPSRAQPAIDQRYSSRTGNSSIGNSSIGNSSIGNSSVIKSTAAPRGFVVILLLISLFVLSGCGRATPSTTFAANSYPAKSRSINGLGVFEKLCNQSGARFFIASRLSSRLEKADCILMIGDTFKPPAKEARDWIEEWLARKTGRSVVYTGRDFDADIYYRQQTLEHVPADQRSRAMVDLAHAQSQLDVLLLEQLKGDVFCRWFILNTDRPPQQIRQFAGPWSAAISNAVNSNAVNSGAANSGAANSGDAATWPVRVVLEVPSEQDQANKPAWVAAPTMTARPRTNQPTGQAKEEELPLIFTSYWSATDINDDDTWESEWSKTAESEIMLGGSDGTPLVTRLTSDRYPDSQIILLANAAPLLNGSLVKPHFREVAHKIIDQLHSPRRIAVLPLNEWGIQVSRVPEEDNDTGGLSVLTTWPMNIIIAHLAFLGVLFCLALYPILGRPQTLAEQSVTDFGQHAEALGQMLGRTRDRKFALKTIADYFRIVRGEVLPSWLQPPAVSPPTLQADKDETSNPV